MSENTAPNSDADSENTSPADPTPVLETQSGESKFTPDQIRRAFEPLFRDLNQVLLNHGVKNVEIVAFTTAPVETEIINAPTPITPHPSTDLSNPSTALEDIHGGSSVVLEVNVLEGISIAEIFAAARLRCRPPDECTENTPDGPKCVRCPPRND